VAALLVYVCSGIVVRWLLGDPEGPPPAARVGGVMSTVEQTLLDNELARYQPSMVRCRALTKRPSRSGGPYECRVYQSGEGRPARCAVFRVNFARGDARSGPSGRRLTARGPC
jgi:hypothetical protein